MIQAQEGLANLQQSNFHSFAEKSRNLIESNLKDLADKYMHKEILDYKIVVANLARKLRNGR